MIHVSFTSTKASHLGTPPRLLYVWDFKQNILHNGKVFTPQYLTRDNVNQQTFTLLYPIFFPESHTTIDANSHGQWSILEFNQ